MDPLLCRVKTYREKKAVSYQSASCCDAQLFVRKSLFFVCVWFPRYCKWFAKPQIAGLIE